VIAGRRMDLAAFKKVRGRLRLQLDELVQVGEGLADLAPAEVGTGAPAVGVDSLRIALEGERERLDGRGVLPGFEAGSARSQVVRPRAGGGGGGGGVAAFPPGAGAPAAPADEGSSAAVAGNERSGAVDGGGPVVSVGVVPGGLAGGRASGFRSPSSRSARTAAS